MIVDKSAGDAPLDDVFDGLEERAQNLELGVKKYASAIAQAFSGAVASGKQFDDVLKSVALRMSQMAVQAAMRPIARAVAGSFDKMFEGLFGGMFAGGGSLATPGYFPTSSDGGGFATDAAAAASPSRAFGGLAGNPGAASHVSINISTPDAESFRRSEAYVTGQIARAVARGQRTL